MKGNLFVRALLWIMLVAGIQTPVALAADRPQSNNWIGLASGIDYQMFHLSRPRPVNLHVARLLRNELSAVIDSAFAHGRLGHGRETVSGMAERYDQAINYWGETWGNRNRVVVAINGYYFNPSTGQPLSGQIQSGWYAQRFSDYVGDAGFAWNLDRSAHIGKCVAHVPRDQFLTILRSSETKKINGLNTPRGADELVLYTPQFGASTGTDAEGVEVLVQMARPTLVLPDPAKAIGQVVEIRDLQGNTPIPFDHIVLSASGVARTSLLSKLQPGDEIGVSQEISDCPGLPVKNWTKTYAAIGGDNHFLTGGELTVDPSNPDTVVPNSRSAVAYSADFVFFIVADGWNAGVSEGITIAELGQFVRDALAATDAVTLDSGGSSTLVIQGQVVNNTYCNFTRNCGLRPDENGFPITERDESIIPEANPFLPGNAPELSRPPQIHATTHAEEQTGIRAAALEALVGNALMMVAVEPLARYNRYAPGQPVATLQAAELRLGPGTNFAILSGLSEGALGYVQTPRYSDLNGVLAKGAYWQPVEFGSLLGWVRQDLLAGTAPPGTPVLFLPLLHQSPPR